MMRNSNPAAVDKPHRARGLLAASLAAWGFFMILATALPLLANAIASLSRDVVWPSAREVLGPVVFLAAIGLPIALLICFAVGYPAWKFASTHGLTTRWDAIRIGAIVGAVLYVLVAMSLHILVYLNASSVSYSQGGILLTKDSLPTLQGIVFDLFLTLFYAADGAVAGLAAWLVGGSR